LLGCPKFDDVQEYIRKFTDIFRTADVQSFTVLDMEVPCCAALPVIVRKGMEIARKDVPIEVVGNQHQRKGTKTECICNINGIILINRICFYS
jgi:hypothetical protein